MTITSALRSGVRAGVIVACVPLISDLVVVAGTLLVLDQLPRHSLDVVGVLGGMVLIMMGLGTFREAAGASLAVAREQGRPRTVTALRQGTVVNLFSPHPWIAWATVLGPLTLRTWRDDHVGAAAFVASFYVCLVGAKILLAVLVGRAASRLHDRSYRVALRASGALLGFAGLALIADFGSALL